MEVPPVIAGDGQELPQELPLTAHPWGLLSHQGLQGSGEGGCSPRLRYFMTYKTCFPRATRQISFPGNLLGEQVFYKKPALLS